MPLPIKVALFARVSTKTQDNNRQIDDLKSYANRSGYNIVEVITEQLSGTTAFKDRPQIHKILMSAKSGEIDKVLITEVSRLGRKTSDILQIIEILTELRVSVVILNYRIETLLPNKKINPVATLLFTLLAEFARLEKELLKERINSGLERAIRNGVKLGRPKGSQQSEGSFRLKYKHVISDLRSGLSIRKISKIRGVSINTIQKVKTSALD